MDNEMARHILLDYLQEMILACELTQKDNPKTFSGSPEEELMHSLQALREQYEKTYPKYLPGSIAAVQGQLLDSREWSPHQHPGRKL
jgi:hypothetical protein